MLTNLFFYFRTAKNVGHVDLFQRFIDAADFILREDNVGGAADIVLTQDEVRRIDETLEQIDMSDVFGGSKVEK